MSVTISTDLCIQVVNGQTVNHPALVSNIVSAFGQVPDNYEPFNRITFNDSGVKLSVYEVSTCTYVLNTSTNFWEDSWAPYPMTARQISTLQQAVQTQWAANPQAANFTAWTYDSTTNSYVPPSPAPTDGLEDGETYYWQGSTNSWQIGPTTPPNDGQLYTWNYTTWAWAVVQPTPTPA
jgi:hypothetical protein